MCTDLWLPIPCWAYDEAGDVAKWLISWHWGSILTVIVALGALAAGAWYNRKTLRQSADLNRRTQARRSTASFGPLACRLTPMVHQAWECLPKTGSPRNGG
jgi:hypothetical protein